MRNKFVILLLLLYGPFANSQTQKKFLLFNVNIINVNDGSVLPSSAVLVEQGKIKAIGQSETLFNKNKGVFKVDGKSKFLIPGLWDMHVHLEGADLIEDNLALFPIFLAYGITTVRDCASDLGLQVLKWRNQIIAGTIAGPTIYTAGRKLEGKNSIWKGDLEISNEAELRSMLDTLDRDKVDFIKITENTLQGDLFLKAVQAAHARGYRVSGHVPIDASIEELVDAGFTSVEHASYLMRLGADESKIAPAVRSGRMTKKEADSIYASTFDPTRAAAEYKKLAAKGLFVCPTLIGSYQLAYLKETDHSNDPFLQFLTLKYVSNYEWRIQRMANETPAQLQQRKDRLEMLKKQLPAMQSAGLKLMAGSDAAALNTYVYPAESLIKELEIFAEAGLTPLQILQSATTAGAKYFGVLQKTSTVEVGKNADLVLLDSNPLDNISNLRKVNTVVARGVLYDRAQLDRMLLQAKATKTRLDKERAK